MKDLLKIILIMILGLGSTARADVIDERQARELAVSFFFERISQYRSLPADAIQIRSVYTESGEDSPLYYVFNMIPDGFIAVSAVGSTHPVLCYSFRGSYAPEGQPENFRAWMQQYRASLEHAARQTGANSKHHPLWNRYSGTDRSRLLPFNGRDVLPMLHTTWDQGRFYNEQCPADPLGPSGHCVTGCVATALAQLMNYFRWPDSGTGSYSYECPPYGTLSADFENSQYEWDRMASSLAHSNPEVAELMFHIGVSVDMVYGPNGSGMYNHKGAYTLKTYFKYSQETQYVFRDSTTMDWDSLLVAHLDQGIPMYYAGWSVPDTNGHAFIADGYQGIGYYHFNWGWGGSYDGYFYTNNLNPGGNNFNLAQELIINAFPDTSLYVYPQHCSGTGDYTDLFGTLSDGSGPLCPYQNSAGCSWLIAPADSVNGLRLQFHDFSLAEGDTLKIYEGDTVSAPLIAALSGDGLPEDVITASPALLVTFVSDDQQPGDGFLAEFYSDIPVYCSGTANLNLPTDTISDGSGSWNYHDNSMCMWRIMPPGATFVSLSFLDFATEEGTDAVKIYDLQTQELLAEYSGEYGPEPPPPVTAESGKMLIIFSTNHSVTAAGWTAVYETDAVGTGEDAILNPVLYPNPTTGKFNLTGLPAGKSPVDFMLTDISGRVLLNMQLQAPHSGTVEADLSHLTPGIYLYRISVPGNTPFSGKIMVR